MGVVPFVAFMFGGIWAPKTSFGGPWEVIWVALGPVLVTWGAIWTPVGTFRGQMWFLCPFLVGLGCQSGSLWESFGNRFGDFFWFVGVKVGG